jgi:hypothetical protein
MLGADQFQCVGSYYDFASAPRASDVTSIAPGPTIIFKGASIGDVVFDWINGCSLLGTFYRRWLDIVNISPHKPSQLSLVFDWCHVFKRDWWVILLDKKMRSWDSFETLVTDDGRRVQTIQFLELDATCNYITVWMRCLHWKTLLRQNDKHRFDRLVVSTF